MASLLYPLGAKIKIEDWIYSYQHQILFLWEKKQSLHMAKQGKTLAVEKAIIKNNRKNQIPFNILALKSFINFIR